MDRPRILIVDDERLIRWSLQQKLKACGYRARDAGTGEEALSRVEEERPDLVLLDVRLPGLDGMEVLNRIRSLDPSIRVVMLSAGDAVEQAELCRAKGAVDYVVKPFDLATVLEVVRKALAGMRRKPLAAAGTQGGPALPPILGDSPAIRAAVEALDSAAKGDDPVLVRGEPGTGKYFFARTLSVKSARSAGPFLRVDCAALPDHLCEYEVLGHARDGIGPGGGPQIGLIERAVGGTLYLEEITAMKPGLQEQLAGLLREGVFSRIGGSEKIPADVRVVAGTSRDLGRAVKSGWFREDLVRMLSRHVVCLPPLRERRPDIPVLARFFLVEAARRYGRETEGFSPEAEARLSAFSWPGNVSELRTIVEGAVLAARGVVVEVESLPARIRGRPLSPPEPTERGEAWAW